MTTAPTVHLPTVITNEGLVIFDDVVQQVREGARAVHLGRDHYGEVWCGEDGLFYEEVHVKGEIVETAWEATIPDLAKLVNDKYGWA